LSSERKNIVSLQAFQSNNDPTAAETWDLKSHMPKVKQENSAEQKMSNY
jgi:hypothetical protein